MAYRKQMGCEDDGFRGIGLSSRKNLCLNPDVSASRPGWA
jgi:DNA excision repair protein ERCC-2